MTDGSIDALRLTLKPLEVDDAIAMVEVLAAESLYEFTGGEAPTLSALQERYGHQVNGSGDPDESWHNWIIRTRDANVAVGFVQATVTGVSADIAWLVGVDYQQRGFAAEAAMAMSDWLVRQGIEQIEAHIHTNHTASQGVATRVGLSPTGQLDEDGEEIWAMLPSSD